MEENELQEKIEILRERRKAKHGSTKKEMTNYFEDEEVKVNNTPDRVFGVVTYQTILVLIIAIIYVVMLTIYPAKTREIASQFKQIFTNDFNLKEVVYDTVGDILTALNQTMPVEEIDEVNVEYNGMGGEKSSNIGNLSPTNVTLANVIYTGSIMYPLENSRITSGFGLRKSPTTGEFEFHNAIDIAAPMGDPIFAVANGKVVGSNFDSSLGNYIVVEHANGFRTKYGHCSELLVEEGMVVREGEVIAKIGSTGDSTGPHVHFAASKNGVYFNPEYLYTYVENWGENDDRI